MSLDLVAPQREAEWEAAVSRLAFATKTCQIAAFVRGIIGLIILSRTHAYPPEVVTGRASVPYARVRRYVTYRPVERVRGVISFGAIKGPAILIPAGILGPSVGIRFRHKAATL